ncbi:MAG: response regulator transcription factor [Arenicellales bacterium]
MRILLVEDDTNLALSLEETLAAQAHSVDKLDNGLSAYQLLKTEHYDAVVLDLSLPKMNGLEVLKLTREQHNLVPIIILTAQGDIDSRVKALNTGADDYLVKPFSTDELLARLGAISRRAKLQARAEIKIGNLTFDSAARRLFIREKEINIPKREIALLECLLQRQGKVVSKGTILDCMFSLDEEPKLNVIDLYIHRLRKRLATADKVRISTLRGLGFLIDTDA